MDDLRGRPFSGAGRWFPATYYPVLALIAIVFVREVLRLDDPLFLMPMAWYTGAMVVPTVALAGAYVFTRRLPDGRLTAESGETAVAVTGWPWQWRWNVLADAGIAALSGYLLVSSLGSPEARPIASIALLIPLIWFGTSTLLSATGRRRLDAIILTDTEVIRDSINGRERVRRDQVTDVKLVRDWVFIRFGGPVERRTGPRPWRRDARLDDTTLMIDPELIGPEPTEIVDWLRAELRLDASTEPEQPPGATRRHITRWWKGTS